MQFPQSRAGSPGVFGVGFTGQQLFFPGGKTVTEILHGEPACGGITAEQARDGLGNDAGGFREKRLFDGVSRSVGKPVVRHVEFGQGPFDHEAPGVVGDEKDLAGNAAREWFEAWRGGGDQARLPQLEQKCRGVHGPEERPAGGAPEKP